MVGGAFWPTTTGEPGHLMAFWNSTIHRVSPCCGPNATAFDVAALHQVGLAAGQGLRSSDVPVPAVALAALARPMKTARPWHPSTRRTHCSRPTALQVLGRNDTVRQLSDSAYFVGQRVDGSFAVRVLATGNAGAEGLPWAGMQEPLAAAPSAHSQQTAARQTC